jgi:hypothetical protein
MAASGYSPEAASLSLATAAISSRHKCEKLAAIVL